MSRIAITGAGGFVGWHTAVRLRAEHRVDPVRLGRQDFEDAERLGRLLADIDTVIHLAGVNRAESDEAVEQGNVDVAERLSEALSKLGRPVHLVYGNSIQSTLDHAYGRGKSRAADLLRRAVESGQGSFADVLLPNIFGEHGRPHYNSFVSTFSHEVARGRKPQVIGDKQVPLLHAQGAAEVLISMAHNRRSVTLAPDGEHHGVSEVLGMLVEFHEKYAQGQIPALPTKFAVDLFNTYRSYLFPQHYPFQSTVHADSRGELFETVRFHGGTGQSFVSTTNPGITRGDHFHLSKIERFFVIKGRAEIAMRRVYDDEVVRFDVSGGDRSFVDMPTMWVHNITNIGNDELITMFWTDQLLDPAAPDTYWESTEKHQEIST